MKIIPVFDHLILFPLTDMIAYSKMQYLLGRRHEFDR